MSRYTMNANPTSQERKRLEFRAGMATPNPPANADRRLGLQAWPSYLTLPRPISNSGSVQIERTAIELLDS